MNKALLGLVAVPLLASAAFAAQPLTDRQMDAVTAGFDAFATAESQALGKIVTTTSSTVALVANVTTPVTIGTGSAARTILVPVSGSLGVGTIPSESTLFLIKSISASTSASTATNNIPTISSGFSTPVTGP